MTRLNIQPGEPVHLRDTQGDGGQRGYRDVHVFEQDDIDAIEAALDAQRPLLVRGEPGVGKSQLALAAAVVLKRGYCQFVVDGMTEARDLRWREDAVARLADAQLIGSYPAGDQQGQDLRKKLDRSNYVQPGPLWWAFDWVGAETQPGSSSSQKPSRPHGDCDPENGMVVLLDEIDKADPDVPNGLLEALGSREFRTPENSIPVTASNWPLVVITTNEERVLPDAFLRRCVVHNITLPDHDEDKEVGGKTVAGLKTRLVARGEAHFPGASQQVLQKAAELTARDRKTAKDNQWSPLPGQAEYLDLLRAVVGRDDGDDDAMLARLERLSGFFLKKHPDARR